MMLHSVFDELKRMIEVGLQRHHLHPHSPLNTHHMSITIPRLTPTLPANCSGVAVPAVARALNHQRRRHRQGWCGLECS